MPAARAKTRTIGTAVVGAGRWGQNLVRDLGRLGGSKLVRVCDLSDDVRRSVAKTGVDVTDCLADITTDPTIEAVAVAVPAAQHHRIARELLLAGKHVLLEKPMALQVEHALELRALAKSQHLGLMVGHLMEYHPGIEYLREAMRRGTFGRVHYVHSRRLGPGPVRTDENVLWGLAVHDVAIAQALLGQDPVEVSVDGGAYVHEGIVDTVFATLRFADGTLFNIHASWLEPLKERRLTVMGSQRMAVFDDLHETDKIRVFSRGTDDLPRHPAPAGENGAQAPALVEVPLLDATEPLLAECRHFLDAVRDGRVPRSNADRGVAVVQVLAAAERSMRLSGQPVTLEWAA